jgi:uncharacterized protein
VSTTETTDQARPVRFEPPVTPTTEAFWDATRDQRLLLQWCTVCETAIFFPREVCPSCLGSSLEWRPASGRGVVYAVTVEYKPQNPMMAAMAPYAVALVDLEEGVRLLSNVVGGPAEDVTVGMAVEVAWEPLSDGRNLPQFRPSRGGRA